jgi:hypothetical protein
MLLDISTARPNYLRLAFLLTDPNNGSTVFRLPEGSLKTFQGQFSQPDPRAISEWILVDYPAVIATNGWVYIYLIVNPNTLVVTAVGSGTGNSVLQVCYIGSPSELYLNLAKVAGTLEQTSVDVCYPIAPNAVPLP